MKKLFNAMSDALAGDLDRIGSHGLTRLQQAVADDDVARVTALIKLNADLNHPGLNGQPPLHRALATGRDAIARLLIAAGADINLPDAKGHTALHKAVLQGNTALTALLLSHGADPNVADHEGCTPLHLAPAGCDDCILLLAKAGGDVNAADRQGRRPLHYYLKHERMLGALLAQGADPNLAGAVPGPFAVALSMPLVASHAGVMTVLLRGGADINAPALNGERLIHVAARLGQATLFRHALEHADINVTDNKGNTALHALMHLPQPDHVQMLLAKAPQLIARTNQDGQTPIQLVVNELIETPANGADTYVNTLITIARVLLAHGADASTGGLRGVTLLHEAVQRGRFDLIDALAAHNVDLDRTDQRGVAPLQIAVDLRRLDLVDRLLDLGADPDLIDARGWTLLDRLAEKKDRDSPIVQRLIVAGGQYNKQLPLYPELIRPRQKQTATPLQDNVDWQMPKTARPPAEPAARVIRKPRPPTL